MDAKVIKGEDLEESDFGDTKVTDVLGVDEWPWFSVAKVEKVGDDVKTGYDKESNVVYYVLEGEGKCILNGKEYDIKKGDCVLSPKGTKYKNLKGLTLLAIASPPFDRGKRVYIE